MNLQGNLEMDRKDNNGNYSPDNIKASTKREQANNRRSNIFYECAGQRKTIPEWARSVGMKVTTLARRLKEQRLPIEEALTKPLATEKYDELRKEAKKRGLNFGTVKARINKYGWSVEKALDTPVNSGRS